MSAAIRSTAVALVVLTASAAEAQGRELTFADRVAAQEAIERVYYSHQIGAERSFEEAVPRERLERKVVKDWTRTAGLAPCDLLLEGWIKPSEWSPPPDFALLHAIQFTLHPARKRYVEDIGKYPDEEL